MKNIMITAGKIFIGLFGLILFIGDKVTSGIVLIFSMIILFIPIKQNKYLRYLRIVFICVIFILVIRNISTTELPHDAYSTGFKFLDQLIHIFRGFLERRFFIDEPGKGIQKFN